MAETHTAVVARGARLLDQIAPGWAYKVRLNQLDIDSTLDCVLGQVFSTYDQGLDVISDNLEAKRGMSEFARQTRAFHMFIFVRWDDDEGYDEAQRKVHALWKQEIRKRRGRSGTRGRLHQV